MSRERRDTSALEKSSSSDEAKLSFVIPEDLDHFFWIPLCEQHHLLSLASLGLQKEDAFEVLLTLENPLVIPDF